MSAFDNATLMITGGTGSFGSTVLKHFLDSDLKEIRIFSRDEKKQDDMRHELQAKHPDTAKKVKFYIGIFIVISIVIVSGSLSSIPVCNRVFFCTSCHKDNATRAVPANK